MAVGNNDSDPVHSFDARGAGIDRLDTTQRAVNLQQVADANRTFAHQDPSADEVVDDVLRSKSDADGNRTRNKGECA